MEKKIRQLLRYLQIEYVAVWVLPLLLVALYETGVMTEGAYAGDVRMDYVLQTVGILLAVGLIPLSLRLFSLSLVKNVKQRSLPEVFCIFLYFCLCHLFDMLFFQMQIYEFPKNSIKHGQQRNKNKHTYNSHKVSTDRNCCKNPD